MRKRRYFTVSLKIHLYITLTILLVLFGAIAIAYNVTVVRIDNNFKVFAQSIATNYASFVDVSFYSKLKNIIETDEYVDIRNQAEVEDNESLIEDYLIKQGIWQDYVKAKDLLSNYLDNMNNVRYLYIIIFNDDSEYDMYLMDTYEESLYSTGMLEKREEEFDGLTSNDIFEPVINNGEWGWLCSAYQSVYDENGNYLCHMGNVTV